MRVRERDRGGDEGEGECERGRGLRGVAREGQSDKGEARQGGGGTGVASTPPATSWQQLEEDKGRRWAGPTVLGHSWAARFALSLSLSLLSVLILFCFLIFLQVCGFSKNT